jgi:hypothetical protein
MPPPLQTAWACRACGPCRHLSWRQLRPHAATSPGGSLGHMPPPLQTAWSCRACGPCRHFSWRQIRRRERQAPVEKVAPSDTCLADQEGPQTMAQQQSQKRRAARVHNRSSLHRRLRSPPTSQDRRGLHSRRRGDAP